MHRCFNLIKHHLQISFEKALGGIDYPRSKQDLFNTYHRNQV